MTDRPGDPIVGAAATVGLGVLIVIGGYLIRVLAMGSDILLTAGLLFIIVGWIGIMLGVVGGFYLYFDIKRTTKPAQEPTKTIIYSLNEKKG